MPLQLCTKQYVSLGAQPPVSSVRT